MYHVHCAHSKNSLLVTREFWNNTLQFQNVFIHFPGSNVHLNFTYQSHRFMNFMNDDFFLLTFNNNLPQSRFNHVL